MKIKHHPLALVICGSTLLLAACKKEEPMTSTVGDPQKALGTTTSEAKAAADKAAVEAEKQAADAKAAAEKAAAEAQKPPNDTAAQTQTQAQGLIDRAKSFVAEKKYTEALASLKELSNLKLTPEQQKWMDELKAQIQKAMAARAAGEATKSIGGLLDKK